MRVVADTNALLLPFTDGTDLRDELQRLLGDVIVVVPSSVAAELEHLASGDGQTARAAQAALRYAAAWPRETTDMPGDDGVLEVARRIEAVVVSNDKRLQGEARRSGLQVVQSRGHGRLHLV